MPPRSLQLAAGAITMNNLGMTNVEIRKYINKDDFKKHFVGVFLSDYVNI